MPLNKLPKLREPRGPVVQAVRDKFLEEEYKPNPADFYPQDIKHIENMDFLLQRCVIMQRKDVDASVKMVAQMLRWRKENKLYELHEDHFPQEMALCGGIFVYEKDKFGNRTLFMRPTMCKNCAELKPVMKEYMNYMLMKVDDCKEGTSFSVVFDLTKAGWSNYDLDLLMHFLSLLRDNFPVNLDYVLAINFPWLLSAVWALVKKIIPSEKRGAVQFISSDKIFDFIARENCPDFLGGTCKRPYRQLFNNAPTSVNYLLDQYDGSVSVKRLQELLVQFQDILPESHYLKLKDQIQQYKDGEYKPWSRGALVDNNNNNDEMEDLNNPGSCSESYKFQTSLS